MELLMRRLSILPATALIAAFAASTAAAVPGVATGNVNMRTDATVNAPRIATIPAGAAVEVHGCPSWCQVTYNGRTGWASSNYISTQYAGDYEPEYAPTYVVPRYSYYEPAPRRWYYDRGPVWHNRYGFDRGPYGYNDGWYGRHWNRGPGISFGFSFDD
jgi:uncharacterized protein YraI